MDKTKRKRIILSMIIVLGVALISFSVYSVINFMNIEFSTQVISPHPKQYSPNEVLDMYKEHKKEFNDVAQILLSNKLFFEKESPKAYGQYAEIDWDYNIVKKYFTDQQWIEISSLFNSTLIDVIELTNDNIVDFSYDAIVTQPNSLAFSIEIFYSPNGYVSDYYSQSFGSFYKIDNDWFIGYGSSQGSQKK